MKRFIEGEDRGQWTLLPECLDDWVSEDNPVRAIDAFVDALNLMELGFKVQPAETGRPSFHPSVHVKLYIYGYVNRVPSSRRLEREAGRNLEVMWLLGRRVPDDKVIADFRKDNGPAIRKVCAQFVELCRRLGLLTKASVAIDGSKFKAVNDRDKNFTRNKVDRRRKQLEESVARYLSQLDTADRQEPSEALAVKTQHLKEKIAKIGEEMKKLDAIEKQMLASPDQQISLTDPDARSMATSGRGSGMVGYNLQIAVDTEHHLIVAHEVTMKVTTARSLPIWRSKPRRRSAWKSSMPLPTGAISTAWKSSLRTSRHYCDFAKADNVRVCRSRPLWQAGFCLLRWQRRLSLPGRPRTELSLHQHRRREGPASLLDLDVRGVRAKTSMHNWPATPHYQMGARTCARGCPGAAR